MINRRADFATSCHCYRYIAKQMMMPLEFLSGDQEILKINLKAAAVLKKRSLRKQ